MCACHTTGHLFEQYVYHEYAAREAAWLPVVAVVVGVGGARVVGVATLLVLVFLASGRRLVEYKVSFFVFI